jgi:hypothetical protein
MPTQRATMWHTAAEAPETEVGDASPTSQNDAVGLITTRYELSGSTHLRHVMLIADDIPQGERVARIARALSVLFGAPLSQDG